MEAGEQFVGGFAGGFLAKGGTIGYGIYATTERIIVVNVVRAARPFLGGTMGGLVHSELMPKLSPAESAEVITELDDKKAFDIRKGQISRIELKSPGLLTSGHIVIIASPGGAEKISLRHRVAFERLRDLMLVFDPDVLTLA
jgi:hypothetical protein